MKDQARIVVIGGGVFGTSVAYHLSKMGCSVDEVDYLFGGSAYKQRWATAEYLLEEIMLFKKDLYSRIVYETFKRRGWFQKLWRFNSKWRLQSKKT